jgi:enoyl-CoA hydratase/carnithine racemase
MSEDVIIKSLSEDGVLTLTFNRPQKKNAFNRPAWADLRDTFISAKDNPKVACIVLQGAGNDFSSGMDLADFGGEGDTNEHPFYTAQKAVIDFDKPLIAAAKGIAVGGGATLLFHCDIIYVGESLRMRLPFVSLGLVPEFGASYMLQQIIGSRRAAELFYTAEWIDTAKALETGIATASYSDAELFAKAHDKARQIAQWPIASLQATKRCLKLTHQDGLAAASKEEREGMEALAGAPANIEAVMAFIEKREPDFKQFRE